MWIEKVKLRNWCQFQDYEIELSKGLNAIRGSNGSGKTNLLNSIVYAVTGDLSRLYGVKTDNIRQPADEKVKSGVEIWLKHGSLSIYISRNIKPINQKLVSSGLTEPLTRVEEISKYLESVLGVNERLLLDYVFVPQWGIFGFIDQQPSVRLKTFSELFGTEKAEEIHKVLADTKLDIPTPLVDIDIAKGRLDKHQSALKDIDRQLVVYRHIDDKWDKTKDSNYLTLQNIYKEDELNKKADKLLTQHTELSYKLGEITTKKLESLNKVKQLSETSDALYQIVEDSKIAKQNYTNYHKIFIRKESLLNTIRIQSQVPFSNVGTIARIALRNQLSNLENFEYVYKSFINKSYSDICPTCGTSVKHLKLKADNYLKKLTLIQQVKPRLEKIVTASAFYEDAQICIKQCQNELDSIKDITGPDVDITQIDKLISEYNQLRQQLKDECCKSNGINAKASEITGSLIVLKKEIDSIQVTKSVLHAEGEKQQLEENILYYERMVNDKRNLATKVIVLQELIKRETEELDRLNKEEEKANKLRLAVGHLSEVKDVVKDLPKLASQYYIEAMQQEIDEMLELLSAPYRIHSIENLKFILKFKNGKLQPAERLSGGERVIFALAFRMVVNSRFARELGLLCLDEPTAGLDEDNFNCLEISLGRLRELSKARGLQVILVTHDTGLDGLFDRVIKLQPTS